LRGLLVSNLILQERRLMRTLFDIPTGGEDRQLFEGGISPALFPHEGLLWTDGENVVFRDGGPRSMNGWSRLFYVPARPTALAQAYVGSGRLYFGTADKLYTWEPTSGLYELGSDFNSGEWSLAVFGKWLIAANGRDQVVAWRNSFATKASPLAIDEFNWAKIVRTFNAHVLAINTSVAENEIVWCSADDVDDWTLTLENSAGNLVVRDLESEIVAAEFLGDQLALYSKDSMALLQYTGYPYWFGVNRALDTIGAVSKNAVVTVEKLNFGMGLQGVWMTDGLQVRYIDEPAMRDYLFDDINLDAVDKVCAYHDEFEHQVIWFYPSGTNTENDKGVGFNYNNRAWTKYGFGRSAAIPRSVFDYPVTGDDVGVFEQGKGTRAANRGLDTWVQSKPIDVGDQELYKRLQLIRLGLEATDGLLLYVGAQETLEATPEFFHVAAAEQVNHIIDREAPFFVVKLVGSGSAWSLSSLKLNGVPTGAVV
jgi:hypothetical protein